MPHAELSTEEMALVRREVLQRLASYRLKLEQKYNAPPKGDERASHHLWGRAAPIGLVMQVRAVDVAFSLLGDPDCPNSAIVEAKSLTGLSGEQLRRRLRQITNRLYVEMPELQERAKLRPLMKRMLSIVGHPNCPESVVKEFLALMDADKRKLFSALGRLLLWRENGIVQTAQALEGANERKSAERQVEEFHLKQESALAERRDEWMRSHDFASLSMAELDPIPTAELLHEWNDGNNAFDEGDRAVMRMTLRKRAGIGGMPMDGATVCPACSLLGEACTCRTHM